MNYWAETLPFLFPNGTEQQTGQYRTVQGHVAGCRETLGSGQMPVFSQREAWDETKQWSGVIQLG